jgi:hypothetical protein
VSATHPIPRILVLLGCSLCAAAPAWAGAFSLISGSETLTAVSAREFNGYSRNQREDGTYEPETFAFGNGGTVTSQLMVTRDPTIDDVSFRSIAHKIAGPLARQNYVTGRDPGTTKLLIMVFWGRTTGSAHLSTANYAAWGDDIDALDSWNAQLLGFNTGSEFEMAFQPSLAGFDTSLRPTLERQSLRDTYDSLAVDRYFVILKAYDFQSLWRHKKLKALWETRFSLSERHHDFGEDLPEMARVASLFFGQDSHGLVRIPPVPEGRIDIGQLRTLGTTP